VKPWLQTSTPTPPDRERLQSKEEQQLIDRPSACILCAAARPPAELLVELGALPGSGGAAGGLPLDRRQPRRGDRRAARCARGSVPPVPLHTIMNCAEACPKDLNRPRRSAASRKCCSTASSEAHSPVSTPSPPVSMPMPRRVPPTCAARQAGLALPPRHERVGPAAAWLAERPVPWRHRSLPEQFEALLELPDRNWRATCSGWSTLRGPKWRRWWSRSGATNVLCRPRPRPGTFAERQAPSVVGAVRTAAARQGPHVRHC